MYFQEKEATKNRNLGKKGLKPSKKTCDSEQNIEFEFTQVYYCPCGKQYKSFAAIYLHFREKHNIRLSTRESQTRKRVNIVGNVKKITFLIDQNSQIILPLLNNEQGSLAQNDLRPELTNKPFAVCIQKYLDQKNSNYKMLYSRLVQYLNACCSDLNDVPLSLDTLPCFLNGFVLDYLPLQNSTQVESTVWRQYCSELKDFCDWLRFKNYTSLIVIYEQH